jgi:hypothetical protein
LSPPSSRRASEATKLPSIHELANLASPIELQATSTSPSKRGSLATITEETPNPHHGHSFPPEYSGSNVPAMSKTRSNSYPPSNHGAYPPPPPFTALGSASHQYPPEPHSKRIVQALVFNHDMSRLVKDFEMVNINNVKLILDTRRVSPVIPFCIAIQGLFGQRAIPRFRTNRITIRRDD